MPTPTGSRGWLPSSCAAGGTRSLSIPAPAPNHALRAAGLSAFFGLLALLMAIAPLIPAATSFRCLIGSVGATAALWGVRATRRRDGRATFVNAMLTATGVGTGIASTMTMLALLIASPH
jgi:hypothetical protein